MKGLLAKSQLYFKRHGSTVLTCMGGVGVIATTVMAVKATPKAISLLEKAKEEKGEELTNLDKVKIAGLTYIPAIAMGVGTITCIFGANVLSKRHQAALVSAYAMLDSSYKDYRRKLKELYGQEAHEEIVNALAVEKSKETGAHGSYFCMSCDLTADDSCGEPVLFYDEYSNRYFESTIENVINAEYHLNRNYILRGYTWLNEFYEFLGIDTTEQGDVLGWEPTDEGEYWIEFNHRKTILDDGLECYILEMPFEPTCDYLESRYY